MLLKCMPLFKNTCPRSFRGFSSLKYKLLEPMNENEDMAYGLPEMLNLYVNLGKVNEIVSQMKHQISSSKFEKEKYEKHVKGLYGYIKTTILKTNTEEGKLSAVANHYFQKEGKLIRPLINFGLAELLYSSQNNTIPFENSESYVKQKDWSSLVEILHISSLIHDDIIDNAPTRRGLTSTHVEFDPKRACFGANFMIGRAVRKIGLMEEPQLFQVYATIMDNLTSGEYIQAKKNKDLNDKERMLKDYVIKSYYKTGSLISNSCRGVCLIAKEDLEVQSLAFKFGKHIDDILDYTMSTQALGKEALSDLKEGVVTGPILFALYELSDSITKKMDLDILLKICQLEEKSDLDIDTAAKILNQTNGIERTKWLAYMHVDKCIKHLEEILKKKGLSRNDAKVKEAFNKLSALIFHVLSRQN